MGSPKTTTLAAFLAAATLLTAACTESVGIAGGYGDVQVTMGQAVPAVLAQVIGVPEALAPDGSAGRIAPENVDSLSVRVTGIELLPYCEEAGMQNGDGQCEDLWVPLTLDEPVELNLLALPTEDESPIVIGSGSVPVGEYHKVRLFIDQSVVVFGTAFSVGQSTFEAGVEYPVEIPSAQNSGIKADIDLMVAEDDAGNIPEVGLLFDPDATFRHVVGTGNGRVLMPPVIKARPMYQHQEQNQNG